MQSSLRESFLQIYKLFTKMNFFALVALLIITLNGHTTEAVVFDTQAKTQRYYTLIDEIRCPVCQGQSIGGSNAGLAKDLRKQVVKMLNANKSNDEIRDFMVARYGDFVVYKPPVKTSTLILWYAPFLLLLLLVIMVFLRIKKSQKNASIKPNIDTHQADELLK